MAEVTEQIVREAPEIEAYKLGLLKSAKELADKPITLPTQHTICVELLHSRRRLKRALLWTSLESPKSFIFTHPPSLGLPTITIHRNMAANDIQSLLRGLLGLEHGFLPSSSSTGLLFTAVAILTDLRCEQPAAFSK